MRTPLAKADDLYKLATGEAKYDYNNKTITRERRYRRDGSYFDTPPYRIDDDEIEMIKKCFELTGGNDYFNPATTKEEAVSRNLALYLSPEPCKHGHMGVKTLSGKCYFCKPPDSPRQQAIRAGQRWYMPTEPCPRCGKIAKRNTVNGQCDGCRAPLTPAIISPRKLAVKAGKQWYMPTEPCPNCHKIALKRVNNGQCSGCTPQRIDRSNSPRQQAIRAGQRWYMPTEPCPHCHQIALKRVQDGLCSGCRPKRQHDHSNSPRQQAIRAGRRWYMPTEPCQQCGKIAPRRVQDSLCSACVDAKSLQWIIDNPDMIVTREMAVMLDIDIYRDDAAAGWKWIKTGKDVSV